MTAYEVCKLVTETHQAHKFALVNGAYKAVPSGKRLTGGILLDAFSASVYVAVHDKLNEENRQKFSALPLERAVILAYKLVK